MAIYVTWVVGHMVALQASNWSGAPCVQMCAIENRLGCRAEEVGCSPAVNDGRARWRSGGWWKGRLIAVTKGKRPNQKRLQNLRGRGGAAGGAEGGGAATRKPP